MKVRVDIYEDEVEGDYGHVPGIIAICSKCNHRIEARGTGNASIRHAAAQFREDCPLDESNWYDAEEWVEGPF